MMQMFVTAVVSVSGLGGDCNLFTVHNSKEDTRNISTILSKNHQMHFIITGGNGNNQQNDFLKQVLDDKR